MFAIFAVTLVVRRMRSAKPMAQRVSPVEPMRIALKTVQFVMLETVLPSVWRARRTVIVGETIRNALMAAVGFVMSRTTMAVTRRAPIVCPRVTVGHARRVEITMIVMRSMVNVLRVTVRRVTSTTTMDAVRMPHGV